MKKLLQKIGNFFKRIFARKNLIKIAEGSEALINILQRVINSPITNVGVLMTPFPEDDKWLNAAKQALPIAAEILHGIVANTQEKKSPAEWVAWVVNEMKTIDPQFKDERVRKLQELIIYVGADGIITEDEAAQVLAEFKAQFLDQKKAA